MIDKTPPTITHALTPVANAAGWNNANVTVSFTCDDPAPAPGVTPSGIASCTKPVTVTTEGASQPVPGTAVDNAGNSTMDPATVSVDKTLPTISGSPDRKANAAHWYNDDVTVSFKCDDALSGVKSCSQPTTLHEGANQSVTGTALDAADNSASASVGGINIDKTAPSLSGTVVNADGTARTPNAAGWYNSDLLVAWSCDDNGGTAHSGIAGTCPATRTVSGEGDNLSTSASVSDLAGNTTNTTLKGLKVDQTAPNTTDDAPAGWKNSGVTVHLSAADNLSGVKATYFKLDGGATQLYNSSTGIVINMQGTHTLRYWSVDNADNGELAKSVPVLIDETAPTISGAPTTSPNSNNWYNKPVTVHFTCSDPKLADGTASGIAFCQPDVLLATDGANQSVTGQAADLAGNMAKATVSGINIDTAAPTITSISVASAKPFILGARVPSRSSWVRCRLRRARPPMPPRASTPTAARSW